MKQRGQQPDSNGDIGWRSIRQTALPSILAVEEPDFCSMDFFTRRSKESFRWMKQPGDTLPLADGTYQCLLELQWFEKQNRNFMAKRNILLICKVDNPPEINISSPENLSRGIYWWSRWTMWCRWRSNRWNRIGFQDNVFSQGTEKSGFCCLVSYYHESNKTYSLRVTAGNVSNDFQIEVLDKEFAIQHLTIDPKIAAATRNDESAGKWKKR